MSNAPDPKLPPVESGTNHYKLTTKGYAYMEELRAKIAEEEIRASIRKQQLMINVLFVLLFVIGVLYIFLVHAVVHHRFFSQNSMTKAHEGVEISAQTIEITIAHVARTFAPSRASVCRRMCSSCSCAATINADRQHLIACQ